MMGRPHHFSAFDAPKKVDQDAAVAALEKLYTADLASQKYTSLSGGQRHKVLIARAVCQSAKIFAMDEPGASLDYAGQQLLMDVVANLAQKGHRIAMFTYSQEHPLYIGHKVLLVSEGRVAAFGKPAETITPKT